MPVHCSTRDHKIKIRNALKNTCQDPAEGNGTEKQSHEESDLHDMSSSEEFGDWGSKSDILGACVQTLFLIGRSSRFEWAMKFSNKFII